MGNIVLFNLNLKLLWDMWTCVKELFNFVQPYAGVKIVHYWYTFGVGKMGWIKYLILNDTNSISYLKMCLNISL